MKVVKLPEENPKPDIENFCKVIKGEVIPEIPPLVELFMDEEIMAYICENMLGIKWMPSTVTEKDGQKIYLKNCIEFWYRMGYDYIRLPIGLPFVAEYRITEDTAGLKRIASQGKRNWVEETKGMISSWEDFDKYPWPSVDDVLYWQIEFVTKNLPDGMGLCVGTFGIFEIVSECLLGFEPLSYLVYDQPDLVEAVFQRVGELIYKVYQNIIELEKLYFIFQGDDLGFKTGTFLSPNMLKKYVLPHQNC